MKKIISLVVLTFSFHLFALGFSGPKINFEFRAGWIASVWNIDWPKKPGQLMIDQKKDFLDLLKLAESLKLNALIVQVRPQGDALYKSGLQVPEPWSHWLTGVQGLAPSYDPLKFIIKEAHKRGIEIHAWLNPYRAKSSVMDVLSGNHFASRFPHLVREMEGRHTWFDPGAKQVQDHLKNVIEDLITRYDLDGIHFDDYFYPYPHTKNVGNMSLFPDLALYQEYVLAGGTLDHADWRRENVNQLVQDVHELIIKKSPQTKFGIAPFGIWRPKHPPEVDAQLDSYAHIFADSRKWLKNSWVDYLSPQLYWSINSQGQPFEPLLKWWAGQNTAKDKPGLWPGIAADRMAPGHYDERDAQEIIDQINLTRTHSDVGGFIFWSLSSIQNNYKNIQEKFLEQKVFEQISLVPKTNRIISSQIVTCQMGKDKTSWSTSFKDDIRWWLVEHYEKTSVKYKKLFKDQTSFVGRNIKVYPVLNSGEVRQACL